MEEKKQKKDRGLFNGAMGAVAGAAGTMGVSGLMNNRTNSEEIEEEVAQNTVPNHHGQNHDHQTDDGDIEDNIIDNGTDTAQNALDENEIHPVDGGGSSTEVLNAELLDVNPDDVAQEIILEADEADNYVAMHSVDDDITDESIWTEEEVVNDISLDEENEMAEIVEEEAGEDEVDEEMEEEELDEELDEDLADSDASDDAGEIIDDII